MSSAFFDQLFEQICELVLCHSPSGAEDAVDQYLIATLTNLGVDYLQDAAGNIIAHLPGQGAGAIAITAHKDEIGAIVKEVEPDGCLRVGRLGGAYPWVYGEGVVDILGDRQTISGILSFGSRHVSHASPQKLQQEDMAVRWEDAWVETKQSEAALHQAGVRPGSRLVVGKHRKHPFRLTPDYIASYTLDNKASLAILLQLAATLKHPLPDVYLVASAKEEVGAVGAMYFTQQQPLAALIALEVCPLASEYPLVSGPDPVLLSQDSYGLYDEGLNHKLRQAAARTHIPLQEAVLSQFGSDGSIAMKFGHVPRAACLSFPTDNTHGYEIAHLGAIANCYHLLQAACQNELMF